jgi:hypothetical protein
MTRVVIPGGGTPVAITRGKTRTKLLAREMACSKARWATLLLVCYALAIQGCAKHPSHDECNALLDHYVELLVNSDRPGTNAAEKHKLQREAREKAKEDPEFAACSERVSRREFDCAMNASNADLLEQCLL